MFTLIILVMKTCNLPPLSSRRVPRRLRRANTDILQTDFSYVSSLRLISSCCFSLVHYIISWWCIWVMLVIKDFVLPPVLRWLILFYGATRVLKHCSAAWNYILTQLRICQQENLIQNQLPPGVPYIYCLQQFGGHEPVSMYNKAPPYLL